MTCKRLFSNGVVAGAIAALMTMLGAAAASATPFCEQYAQRAVEHVAQARANNCGFTGKKNWHSSTRKHFEFCRNVGQGEAQTYERGRAQAIKACIANKKKGTVGTWKGSTGKKSDAKSDAKCQNYIRKFNAIYREAARLCKWGNRKNTHPVENCFGVPASKRDAWIDKNLATVREMRAKCARR